MRWMWAFVGLVGCSVDPTAGRWAFTENEIVSDTCNVDLATYDDTTFELASTDEGFTIGSGSRVTPCSLSGQKFSCDLLEDEATVAAEATLTLKADLSGKFHSDTELDGTAVYTTDCEGEGCGGLSGAPPFPCTTEVDFVAELSQE